MALVGQPRNCGSIVAQFPTERRYLSVFKTPLTLLGFTQPSFQLLLRDSSQVVKILLREAKLFTYIKRRV